MFPLLPPAGCVVKEERASRGATAGSAAPAGTWWGWFLLWGHLGTLTPCIRDLPKGKSTCVCAVWRGWRHVGATPSPSCPCPCHLWGGSICSRVSRTQPAASGTSSLVPWRRCEHGCRSGSLSCRCSAVSTAHLLLAVHPGAPRPQPVAPAGSGPSADVLCCPLAVT